jgi:hypothetical protein
MLELSPLGEVPRLRLSVESYGWRFVRAALPHDSDFVACKGSGLCMKWNMANALLRTAVRPLCWNVVA